MPVCWERNEIRMKKIAAPLIYLFFFLTALFPVATATAIATAFGYRFRVLHETVFGIAIGILPLMAFFADLLSKPSSHAPVTKVFASLLGPLALLNIPLYLYAVPDPGVMAGVFLAAGCGFYFTIKYTKPLGLKITAIVLSGVATMPMVLLSLFFMTFGSMGQETVVRSLPSPTGKYHAQVISRDEGALGGSTRVEVYESSKSHHLVLFQLEKAPRQVYSGEWYEYETIAVSWEDDTTLRVNRGIYPME